ncbi:hypothetical protein KIN_24360 [Litoreibacter roseus]|uniref:Uncharacterized protein n=1 Tax=Litoreibacter roseus TaxID=2601869 RepID=A0A6N6JJJ2_9RHOB|nr:hypothetical protein KIN_24360 [Litoreibacter roseus]
MLPPRGPVRSAKDTQPDPKTIPKLSTAPRPKPKKQANATIASRETDVLDWTGATGMVCVSGTLAIGSKRGFEGASGVSDGALAEGGGVDFCDLGALSTSIGLKSGVSKTLESSINVGFFRAGLAPDFARAANTFSRSARASASLSSQFAGNGFLSSGAGALLPGFDDVSALFFFANSDTYNSPQTVYPQTIKSNLTTIVFNTRCEGRT